MKVLLKKRVGDLELEIEAEGRDEKDIFPQLEFWSSLPTSHPSGATDFQVAARPARTAQNKTVTYYEIVCKSADERFCFGQATDEKGGGLFPKGWEPIYHGSDEPPQTRQPETRQAQQVRQQTTGSNGQSIDAQIRTEYQRLGISQPGQEKMATLKALGGKVGMTLAELAETEKGDFLAWLRDQKTTGGA